MSKTKPLTAAELMQQLEGDSEYQAKMAKQQQKQTELEKQYQSDATPLLQELAAISVDEDLYGLAQKYGPLSDEIVEILLSWLPVSTNERVLEGIVRSLALPRNPYDGTALAQLFDKTNSDTLRWIIANTIAEARPLSINEWLTETARNASYGDARQMLIVAVGRMIDAESAIPMLKEASIAFPAFAAMALAECGDKSTIEFLKKLKRNASAMEQQEISKAISQLNQKT